MSTLQRQLPNPTPLGLGSFGINTLVYSLFIAGAHGVKTDNVGLGLALFHGGVIQVLAGMWEMWLGNTFPATVFSSYGGFWISFGFISLPGSGIRDAYAGNDEEFQHAIGIFLIAWTIYTFFMLICALRTNVAMISTFFFLLLTYIFLVLNKFTGEIVFNQIGGSLGVVTAFIAFYSGMSQLLTKETSYFTLPVGELAVVNKV